MLSHTSPWDMHLRYAAACNQGACACLLSMTATGAWGGTCRVRRRGRAGASGCPVEGDRVAPRACRCCWPEEILSRRPSSSLWMGYSALQPAPQQLFHFLSLSLALRSFHPHR